MRLASIFVEGGVNKIRLTGGEPSVRKDIEDMCGRLKNLGGLGEGGGGGVRKLAITTNGLLLSRKLAGMRAAGLDEINISLDTLVEAKFEMLTRRKGHHKVLQGIDRALELGFDPVKVSDDVLASLHSL